MVVLMILLLSYVLFVRVGARALHGASSDWCSPLGVVLMLLIPLLMLAIMRQAAITQRYL